MYVDLGRKIVALLDQPSDALIDALKAHLSHDNKNRETSKIISDRSTRGTHRSKVVVLRGWCSFLFASTNLRNTAEVIHRGVSLSPTDDPEKVKAVLAEMTRKMRDPYAYEQEMKYHPKRVALKQHIQKIKEWTADKPDLKIAKPYIDDVDSKFNNAIGKVIPRLMRDYPKLGSFIDVVTIFHHMERRYDAEKNILYSEPEDAEIALKLFVDFIPSIQTGLPPATLSFYKKVIEPLVKKETFLIGDVAKKYYEVYHQHIPRKRLLNHYLTPLQDAGLLTDSENPNDKRQRLYTATTTAVIQDISPHTVVQNVATTRGDISQNIGEELKRGKSGFFECEQHRFKALDKKTFGYHLETHEKEATQR